MMTIIVIALAIQIIVVSDVHLHGSGDVECSVNAKPDRDGDTPVAVAAPRGTPLAGATRGRRPAPG